MNSSGDLSDLKATNRTNSRGNGGTSFGLSRLLRFRSHLHRTCFRSGRKMGQGDPRDSGQIWGTARQPKDDSVDDPHPFGLLHRGRLQLLCLGTDPARWNLVGSSFRDGREEVDLHECGERYVATVSRQPEPTKGLKSGTKSGTAFWVVKKTHENRCKVAIEFVYVYWLGVISGTSQFIEFFCIFWNNYADLSCKPPFLNESNNHYKVKFLKKHCMIMRFNCSKPLTAIL